MEEGYLDIFDEGWLEIGYGEGISVGVWDGKNSRYFNRNHLKNSQ